MPTELNSNRPSDANSTIKKLKVKKRGHSENIHTDGSSKVQESSQIGSRPLYHNAGNSVSTSQTPMPSKSQKSTKYAMH